MIMWSVNYERQILHKSGIKLNTQFDASNLQDKEYKPAVTSSWQGARVSINEPLTINVPW